MIMMMTTIIDTPSNLAFSDGRFVKAYSAYWRRALNNSSTSGKGFFKLSITAADLDCNLYFPDGKM